MPQPARQEYGEGAKGEDSTREVWEGRMVRASDDRWQGAMAHSLQG